MPKPVGEAGGGMANAIVGTLHPDRPRDRVSVCRSASAPDCISPSSAATRLANGVRFLSDVLNGLPSIVIGIFAWQFLVRPFGHFSALAGGVALGAMMIPLVTRTTEEMIAHRARVAARGGARARLHALAHVAQRSCCAPRAPGIVTGALVAIARIAGETAPLLFTAFGNQFWSTSLTQPIAALPLQIFTYAISPYDDWHALAWAGALVLIALVLVISLIARFATRARFATGGGD